MSNTVKVSVTTQEGWKLITTASAGAFSVTSSALFYTGHITPGDDAPFHRINSGDIEQFVLADTESLWVKVSVNSNVNLSVTGVGFITDWFRKMSIAETALTQQSYTETNCKKGTQWGISLYNPVLPATPNAGSLSYIQVVTGAKPIALKGRFFEYDGLGIMTNISKDPVFTDRTDMTPLVFNYNDRNPQTLLTKIYSLTSAQVTSVGEMWVPDRHYLGSNKQANRINATNIQEILGLEYWFNENSSYLIALQSIDSTDPQRVSQFGTFYEGFPDLP